MSFCLTPFSGKSIFQKKKKTWQINFASHLIYRARRNARGHLEPDASEDKVQESLGFGNYEHAPKSDNRNIQEGSSNTVDKAATWSLYPS
jgi:hypothetical protein